MKRLLTIILLSAAMCGMSIVCEAQEQVDVNIEDPLGDYPVHRTYHEVHLWCCRYSLLHIPWV